MAEKASTSRSLSRRSFLKTTAAAAGVAAVAGTAGVAAYAAGGPEEAAQNKEVIGSCRSNCGGKCPLKVKVRNGKVVKTEPADMPEGDELYRRICVKGLSQPQRLYDPDRLKYPMRRIEGTERGTEEFERISWDEVHGCHRPIRRLFSVHVGRLWVSGLLERGRHARHDEYRIRTLFFEGGRVFVRLRR